MEALFGVEDFGVGSEFDWNFLFLIDYLELDCSDQVFDVFCGLDVGFVFQFGDSQVEASLCFFSGEFEFVLELEVLPELFLGDVLVFLAEPQ